MANQGHRCMHIVFERMTISQSESLFQICNDLCFSPLSPVDKKKSENGQSRSPLHAHIVQKADH